MAQLLEGRGGGNAFSTRRRAGRSSNLPVVRKQHLKTAPGGEVPV